MNTQRKKQLNKIAQYLKTKSGKDFQAAAEAVAVSLDVMSNIGWREWSHVYCQFRFKERLAAGLFTIDSDGIYDIHLPTVVLEGMMENESRRSGQKFSKRFPKVHKYVARKVNEKG